MYVTTTEQIRFSDTAKAGLMKSFDHITEPALAGANVRKQVEMPYATDYGCRESVTTVSFEHDRKITAAIQLESILREGKISCEEKRCHSDWLHAKSQNL